MAFQDRRANRPNRYKVTPDSGNEYYVTLERADEPTVLGTPINAENLNRLYSPENKPSAADVGALPSVGGKLTGGITIESNNGFLQMDDKDSGGSTRIYKNASSTVDYGTYLLDTAPDGTRGALIIRPKAGGGEKLQLTVTNTAGTSVDYQLYGEHHKPTPSEIGAAPAIESTDFPGCYYRTVNGKVEWVNPPFEFGTEYRTIERWEGKAVFTRIVDLGSLPANSTASHSGLLTTATKLHSMELIAYTSDYQYITLAHDSGITSVIYNRGAASIVIKTNKTFSNIKSVYLKLKYSDDR